MEELSLGCETSTYEGKIGNSGLKRMKEIFEKNGGLGWTCEDIFYTLDDFVDDAQLRHGSLP